MLGKGKSKGRVTMLRAQENGDSKGSKNVGGRAEKNTIEQPATSRYGKEKESETARAIAYKANLKKKAKPR